MVFEGLLLDLVPEGIGVVAFLEMFLEAFVAFTIQEGHFFAEMGV
jgi:hypothetical protein